MRGVNRIILAGTAMLAGLFLLFSAPLALAAGSSQQDNSAQVLSQFDQQQVQRTSDKISKHRKHVILFMMALPLIIMLLITGGLGVAMGVYGKQQLFVTHMLFAGLSITLALVHAIVSMIWFFPF